MPDVFSKEKRSSIMAASTATGTRSTEKRIRARLASAGLSGWRLNPRDIEGHPDIAFDNRHVAVFLDGCFWHGCTRCRKIPATRHRFWATKIASNRSRDRAVTRYLRRHGWTVLRFWEHQIREDPHKCVARIIEAVSATL